MHGNCFDPSVGCSEPSANWGWPGRNPKVAAGSALLPLITAHSLPRTFPPKSTEIMFVLIFPALFFSKPAKSTSSNYLKRFLKLSKRKKKTHHAGLD